MNDSNTSLETIKAMVAQFNTERDWDKFHHAKSICMNLPVEANELMEIFTWAQDSDINEIIKNKRKDIEYEVADILQSLIIFCNKYNIDITQAFVKKMALNIKKYPIEKARSCNKKYNEL